MIAPSGIVILAMFSLPPAAPDDARPARAEALSIAVGSGTTQRTPVIEVRGLDPENLLALSKVDWDAACWGRLLSISVGKDRAGSPSIPGRYRVIGEILRFEPTYAYEPGLHHRVRLDPSLLPHPRADTVPLAEFTPPPVPKPPAAFVVRVEPSGPVLPENLLKFYLYFSAPMTRGQVYEHVRLFDASGTVLVSPFLEIGEELWDASGTRLTLLLDPGRIKRGLRPRDEDGPILESGETYSLRIDREWHDASGQPLREDCKRSFRAGPADETQPDPKAWKIQSPASATRGPLNLTFPEPLDRAMLDRAIVIHDPTGQKVRGEVRVEEGSLRWSFLPEHPWTDGEYTIRVEPELEDLAGNSVARPFEVDNLNPVKPQVDPARTTLPFKVQPARSP
ncbi:MAG: hypothetical protein JWN86_1608 [Planctomycetota bacterium]|nr:hypothetical protein [Planctomycetota bacterium]